jgi:hypothetical protein
LTLSWPVLTSLSHLIDFLAVVVLVVLDLRHDLRKDVVLTLELEERDGTDAAELALVAVDLERVELDVEVERDVPLEIERVDDVARVLEDTGADDRVGDILSLNREAFSCR